MLTLCCVLCCVSRATVAAIAATYPMDTIRRRIQTDGFVPGARSGELRYTGVMTTARIILAQEGWRGFFKGVSVNWMRVRPFIRVVVEEKVCVWTKSSTDNVVVSAAASESTRDGHQSDDVRHPQGRHGRRESSVTSAIERRERATHTYKQLVTKFLFCINT